LEEVLDLSFDRLLMIMMMMMTMSTNSLSFMMEMRCAYCEVGKLNSKNYLSRSVLEYTELSCQKYWIWGWGEIRVNLELRRVS